MSRRVSWFEFGLGLFAAALPIGAIVIAVAPVQFFEAVGAGILGIGLVGLWISALGLQLEDPKRWRELRGLLFRPAASSDTRRPVEH